MGAILLELYTVTLSVLECDMEKILVRSHTRARTNKQYVALI